MPKVARVRRIIAKIELPDFIPETIVLVASSGGGTCWFAGWVDCELSFKMESFVV